MGNQHTPAIATEIRLSFSPATSRIAEALDSRSYRSYLRRTRDGPVAVGDRWNEFVNQGCGTTQDIVLRVESVQDGDSIGEETVFVFGPYD